MRLGTSHRTSYRPRRSPSRLLRLKGRTDANPNPNPNPSQVSFRGPDRPDGQTMSSKPQAVKTMTHVIENPMPLPKPDMGWPMHTLCGETVHQRREDEVYVGEVPRHPECPTCSVAADNRKENRNYPKKFLIDLP